MTISGRFSALAARWDALFRDHEIYMRTGGEVKFLRLSAALQRRVANIAVAVVGVWLLITAGLIGWQGYASWHNRDIASRAVAVEQAEAAVAATAAEIGQSIQRLNARQAVIENVVADHMGANAAAAATAATTAPAAAPPARGADQVSAVQAIARRQNASIAALTRLAGMRAARAEAALLSMGIRANSGGQGGPLVPAAFARSPVVSRDPALRAMTEAVVRMGELEEMVMALPSNLPAEHVNLSSGFGYRHDPFTGAAAIHAGLDFAGPVGSPIRAAAPGNVIYAGVKAGYGNVIEIDHGHGIITRYGHLSRIGTTLGARVAAGDLIAAMGSTGRSTGPHLHFEVRVGGTAVNPRRFLEANSNVLEVKAVAGQRVRRVGTR